MVNCRPFASKVVFFYGFWVRRLLLLGTVNDKLKILQNRSKTAFEAKGRLYSTGKVIKRLFETDLYTYLAIYRCGWDKRYYKISSVTHTDCVGLLWSTWLPLSREPLIQQYYALCEDAKFQKNILNVVLQLQDYTVKCSLSNNILDTYMFF